MRRTRERALGGAFVALLVVLPVVAGWTSDASATGHAQHRSAAIAAESAAGVDGVGVQDARVRSSELSRSESIAMLAVAPTLVLAGCVAIAAAGRRRRTPDPVSTRALARAPPSSTTFAAAR